MVAVMIASAISVTAAIRPVSAMIAVAKPPPA
jgi:hypothetical protein